MIEAVFFDLDGTLADTAPDLAGALNRLLEENGRQPHPLSALRPHVSGGARALIRVGFGLAPDDPGYGDLVHRFLDLYQKNICRETRLFSDMDAVLSKLENQGLLWGVVTNKAERFTREVVRQLGLADRAASIVSGDSTPNPKPAPDPLLLACRQANVSPQQSIYVGDDLRDIQAGKAAGMTTVVAAWGYLGDGPPPENWGGDHIITEPLHLLDLI